MKYMLLIHHDEQGWEAMSEAERQPLLSEFRQLREELTKSGRFLGGAPLQPTSTATSVRLRSGKRLVTDGPFAETREQLGGYFLVDAKDLDEAVGMAARIPAVRWGTVEVRAVVEPRVPVPALAGTFIQQIESKREGLLSTITWCVIATRCVSTYI